MLDLFEKLRPNSNEIDSRLVRLFRSEHLHELRSLLYEGSPAQQDLRSQNVRTVALCPDNGELNLFNRSATVSGITEDLLQRVRLDELFVLDNYSVLMNLKSDPCLHYIQKEMSEIA